MLKSNLRILISKQNPKMQHLQMFESNFTNSDEHNPKIATVTNT